MTVDVLGRVRAAARPRERRRTRVRKRPVADIPVARSNAMFVGEFSDAKETSKMPGWPNTSCLVGRNDHQNCAAT